MNKVKLNNRYFSFLLGKGNVIVCFSMSYILMYYYQKARVCRNDTPS